MLETTESPNQTPAVFWVFIGGLILKSGQQEYVQTKKTTTLGTLPGRQMLPVQEKPLTRNLGFIQTMEAGAELTAPPHRQRKGTEMADDSMSLEDALIVERASFHAHLLGLSGENADRFVKATQDYHAGLIDTQQLMKAMEKTDGVQ
jgi:hypothetical protein